MCRPGDGKWAAPYLNLVSGIPESCPLPRYGESDFHPFPRFRQGRTHRELLLGDRILQASQSLEVEEELTGVEIGVLIAKE